MWRWAWMELPIWGNWISRCTRVMKSLEGHYKPCSNAFPQVRSHKINMLGAILNMELFAIIWLFCYFLFLFYFFQWEWKGVMSMSMPSHMKIKMGIGCWLEMSRGSKYPYCLNWKKHPYIYIGTVDSLQSRALKNSVHGMILRLNSSRMHLGCLV